MPKTYVLLVDRFEHTAGTIVHECERHDYGLRRDDENYTGVEHLFLTLNKDGDYPGFTIPEHYVRPATGADLLKTQGYFLEKEDTHGKVFIKDEQI